MNRPEGASWLEELEGVGAAELDDDPEGAVDEESEDELDVGVDGTADEESDDEVDEDDEVSDELDDAPNNELEPGALLELMVGAALLLPGNADEGSPCIELLLWPGAPSGLEDESPGGGGSAGVLLTPGLRSWGCGLGAQGAGSPAGQGASGLQATYGGYGG